MASQGVRWWYWGIDEWSPFSDFENEELEAAHRSGTEEVPFGGGKYTAYVSRRVQRNLEAGQERILLRATWFFQRTDGSLYPYPEDIADLIEINFPVDKLSIPPPLHLPGGERQIIKLEDGSLVQVRRGGSSRHVTPTYVAGCLPITASAAARTATTAATATSGEAAMEATKGEIAGASDGHGGTVTPVLWWKHMRDGGYSAYEGEDSAAIEAAHRQGGGVATLESGEQVMTGSRTAVLGGESTAVVRGTWYFHRTDGTLCPYPEDVSEQLETVFVSEPAEAEADRLLLKRMQCLGRVLKPCHLGVEHEEPFIDKITDALLEIGPHKSPGENLRMLAEAWGDGGSAKGMACAICCACSASCISDASTMDRHRSRIRRVSSRFGLPGGGGADLAEDSACERLLQGVDILMRIVTSDGQLADLSQVVGDKEDLERLLREKMAKKNKRKGATGGVGFQSKDKLVESRLLIKSADELTEAKEHWKGIQDLRDALYEAEGTGELAVGGQAVDRGDAGLLVQAGSLHYVTRSEEGGFVQVRRGTQTYRYVTRGYRPGRVSPPPNLRPLPLPSLGEEGVSPESSPEKAAVSREAHVKDSRACAAEALLLSKSGLGGGACAGVRVPVSGGGLINYVKSGTEGKPSLVLLQGFGSGAGMWLANMADLASSFTVYAVDLPGGGLTVVPEFSASGGSEMKVEGGRMCMGVEGGDVRDLLLAEAHFVDRLEEWRKELLSQGEPVDTIRLAGFSFGAHIAACYALKYPDQVAKLCMIEPWGLADPPTSPPPQPPTRWLYELYPYLSLSARSAKGDTPSGQFRSVLRDKFRLSCEGLDSTALTGGDDKADWEEPVIVYLDGCLELQGSGSEGALAAMCAVTGDYGILWPRRALAPRLAEDLPSTIPVSVIFAEGTWVDAKPAVDLTAARPGQVQVFVVPMSEHMVYIDNPSAFNEALAQKMR